MRLIYTLALYLLTPLFLLRLLWRSLKAPAYRRRWHERFGVFPDPRLRGTIWVHAVSVGEVQAALPLIRHLRRSFPERRLVVTTVTPTGSERVRSALADQVFHVYAPYDLPGSLSRFLKRVRPALAVIMETEIWPNLFKACQSRDVPIIIANARISPRSYRGYRLLRPLVAATLRRALRIAAQTEDDAGRFRALGANPGGVPVVGNLKFDIEVCPGVLEQGRELRRQLGPERPVLIAASTHAGEEEIVLEAFATVRGRFPKALLIVVPRHPERFAEATRCCRARGYRIALRSQGAVESSVDVFVGDTMGEMMSYLAASDVAFVAGSLVPVGGHNVLEPAALGKPVIFGPHMFNFREPSLRLVEVSAGWRIENGTGLAEVVMALFADRSLRERAGAAARACVASNRGALQRLGAQIQGILEPDEVQASSRLAGRR